MVGELQRMLVRRSRLGETCSIRTDCSSGAAVVFCEGPWTHFEWPPVTQAIFDFLAQEHGQ